MLAYVIKHGMSSNLAQWVNMMKCVLRRPQSSSDIKTFQDWVDFEMS